MNSNISTAQCGKAPELILLSKCHILHTYFFFRPLSPHESRKLNARGCSRSVTAMLSTVLAEDGAAESSHSSHAVVPFQQLNNAFTFQWELHPNMQETANKRADDQLVGKKKTQNNKITLSGHKTVACRSTTSNQRTPEALCLLSHST